jgi:hypothetical protein
MKSNDAILVSLLVLLVIIVAYQGCNWTMGRNDSRGGYEPRGRCDGFRPREYNPRAVLGKQLSSLEGVRHDAYNQPHVRSHPSRLAAHHQSGAATSPENIAEAERELWFAATESANTGGFDTFAGQNAASDTMQYHESAPGIDYSEYITDLVVDDRTKDNHKKWAKEMQPWSGTTMKVDDMDEALAMSTHRVGIGAFALRAPVQYNPTQLTEIDGHLNQQHTTPFRFTG